MIEMMTRQYLEKAGTRRMSSTSDDPRPATATAPAPTPAPRSRIPASVDEDVFETDDLKQKQKHPSKGQLYLNLQLFRMNLSAKIWKHDRRLIRISNKVNLTFVIFFPTAILAIISSLGHIFFYLLDYISLSIFEKYSDWKKIIKI